MERSLVNNVARHATSASTRARQTCFLTCLNESRSKSACGDSPALTATAYEGDQKISSRACHLRDVVGWGYLVLREVNPVLECRNDLCSGDVFQSISLRKGKANGSSSDGKVEGLVEARGVLYCDDGIGASN